MSISKLSKLQSRFNNYRLDKRVFPTLLVQSLVQEMEKQGIPADVSLAGTDIDVSLDRVTYQQRIDQLSNMLDLQGMDGSWLESPGTASISDYGLLGYAMMSSATLEQSVQIAVKYHKMSGAMFELAFYVDRDDAVLRIEHLLPSGRVAQYTVEELFAGICRLIGLLLGRDHKPSRILLNYPAPEYAEKHLQCFRCPVIFDQSSCQYRFSREELAESLAEADSNTARICEESRRKLFNQIETEDDIISRICNLLLSTPGEFPKLDAVASKLSLGARTLRRRLNELGTSYQCILDDVRRELAIEYLRTTNLTVQEIAELLGYSEVTNFRRAFMRWVELSPYQYRKQIDSPA
jgi:AraC-like DNA-binding protein